MSSSSDSDSSFFSSAKQKYTYINMFIRPNGRNRPLEEFDNHNVWWLPQNGPQRFVALAQWLISATGPNIRHWANATTYEKKLIVEGLYLNEIPTRIRANMYLYKGANEAVCISQQHPHIVMYKCIFALIAVFRTRGVPSNHLRSFSARSGHF